MTNKHSNSDSSSDETNGSPEDPDLGFASDSHLPFGPSDRKAFEQAGSKDQLPETEDSQWVPNPQPIVPAPVDDANVRSNGPDTDDTWVPEEDDVVEAAAAEIDPNKTWVPPTSLPVEPLVEKNDPDDVDPNRTWTPSNTPTTDGLAPVDDDQLDDPNRTWVPSSTPTADGIEPEEEHEEEPSDPNRTWVPSSTPTADGVTASDEDSEGEADDLEKTWMPSDTPTADGLPDDSASNGDLDKTWVPSSTPTADGMDEGDELPSTDATWVMSEEPQRSDAMDGDQPPENDPNSTWMPSTAATTSEAEQPKTPDDLTKTVDLQAGAVQAISEVGIEDTVDLSKEQGSHPAAGSPSAGNQSATDSGDVFQKTIGMRRPLDSTDLPPSALVDSDVSQTIHLDLPEGEMNQVNASSTQLWTRQSGANLNHSLTIRSRPVAGDKLFETGFDTSDRPDYQIVEKIGEGGMGAIFLANQTSLDRQLAIKTLKAPQGRGRRASRSGGKSTSADRQRRDMFLAEALITANLVHPHIIPIHDLCETAEGLPFYSMKRVVGTPWCDRLREMELDKNLEVLRKVCDAVAYAHHNGVVNRDLKPENVMLGEFGEVLVLDWGLAVPSSAADKKKFNSPSAPFGAGTPAYMAPELWTGPEEIIGYWSDIYLLGAILFEVITGKAPHKFAEPTIKAGNTGLWMVIDKVVRRNDIRQTEHKGELMDIALKAMQTRPKDRFASVLKFQEALKDFQQHEESRRLSSRAAQTLQSAQDSTVDSGYLGYQSAAALFEEAQTEWAENLEAAEGLSGTRLQYAALAHKKGDFDLGLQIASQEDGLPFVEIRAKLTRSRRLRNTLKSAVIAASAIIVAVGIFSFIQSREITNQNRQIIALHGNEESLQAKITSAKGEIAEVEAERSIADSKAIAAEGRAEAAVKKAEDATLEVAAAEQSLVEFSKKLQEADARLEDATQELSDADTKLATANDTLEDTERKVAELEVKKSRSAVDLKNAEIASLIRNGDYSTALTEVERLLSDLAKSEEMNALPVNEQHQRKIELQARRRQLLQRAVQVDVPVQSQAMGRSGQRIVWADRKGRLQVRGYTKADGVSGEVLAEAQLNGEVSALAISDSEDVVIAASGSTINVWDFEADQTTKLTGHQGRITAIRSAGDFLISADETGSIRGWSLTSSRQLWSMRSSSRILDLVLLPDDQIFIYAGSRGGESADILAYQMSGLADSSERPERLGQLKLPRNQNDPPRSLAVSPDGQRLLISNSRNGSVLVLPRREVEAVTGRDRFPFVHATDLDAKRDRAEWVANRHQRPVNQMSFSADGRRFCTASDDRTIGVWDFTADNRPHLLERLEGHGARVNGAAFTDSTGQQVISIAADRYCRLWDVASYRADKKRLEREFQLTDFQPAVDANDDHGQWTPEALPGLIAMAILPRTVQYLPLTLPGDDLQTPTSTASETWDHSRVFNAEHDVQRGAITSVAISSDGKLLTTGGSDGTAVIWDTDNERPLTAISTSAVASADDAAFDEGHDFNVSRFCFIPPSGTHLLTTGFDGNLCVWNADTKKAGTGHQMLRMPGLGLVNAIATSANGEYVVTSAIADDLQSGLCSVYRTADLLKDAQPQPIAEFTGFHRSEISAISVNDDGSQAVTGGRDGRVALWSCLDGRLQAASRIHTKNTIVSYLKLLSDGSILTAGYDGRLMRLRKSETASSNTRPTTFDVIQRFVHDRIPIERVAVHPDQDRFVTISIRTERATRKVKYELSLWNMNQPTAERTISPAIVEGRPAVRISSVDFSINGRQLAAVVDQRIQVFDTNSWKVIRVLSSAERGMSDVIFSPTSINDQDEQRIATFDGVAANLWDLKTGDQLATFRPLFSVASLAYSKHKRPLLLTGDRSIRFFQASVDDTRFGRCVFKIENPHSGVVNALEFSPAKPDLFASCGTDGSLCVWRWKQDQDATVLVRRVPSDDHQATATDLSWSDDGRHIWVANQSGRLRRYDENGDSAYVSDILAKQDVELSDLTISADGRFIGVCGKSRSDGLSMAWILEQLGGDKLVTHCRLDGHEAGGIRGIRFLPDSPYVVTAGADGACLVWNWMPERSAERPIEAYEAFQFLSPDSRVAHEAPINAISITRQGHVATVSDDGTARLWPNPFRVAISKTSTND